MSWFNFPGEPLPEGFREPDMEGLAPSRPGMERRGGRGLPPPPQTVVQIPPPELAMYPSSLSVYAEGNATIANGANATPVDFALPAGQVGVINSWILYGVNLVVGLVATWELRFNGSVVRGGTRTINPQNAASGAIGWGPDEILFRIPNAGQVQVVISVTAGGPMQLGTQVSGWQYPENLDDRFSDAWRT